MRWILGPLLIFFAIGCGGETQAGARDRERTVVVEVTTIGDRSVEDLTITATLEEPAFVDAFSIDLKGPEEIDGVSGDTCEEAAQNAQHFIDTFAMTAGECYPVQRQITRELDRQTATTNSDGRALFALLDGDYRLSGHVEIVAGDDGCHFAGVATVDPAATEVALVLDSNTCE